MEMLLPRFFFQKEPSKVSTTGMFFSEKIV